MYSNTLYILQWDNKCSNMWLDIHFVQYPHEPMSIIWQGENYQPLKITPTILELQIFL